MTRTTLYLSCITLLLACSQEMEQTEAPPALPEDAPIAHTSDEHYSYAQGIVRYGGEAYSGYVLDLHPDGSPKKKTSIIEGKRNGPEWVWYPNGQLKEQRFYLDHQKHGEHKGWWPDGTPRFRYQFDRGQYDGEVINWFANGKPLSVFHYEQGQEVGSQRLYREDGSFKANYVVRDGRRYGLIGTKGCATLWKKDSLPQKRN